MTYILSGGEGQRGFLGILLVSLCVHVLIVVSLGFVPLTAKPRMTFGPVYTVDLVSETVSIREEHASFLPYGPSTQRTGKGVVLRKEEGVTKSSIFKADSREYEKSLKQALEDLRRRTHQASPQSVVPIVTGTEKTDERFRAYLELIWKSIKNAWVLPELSTRTFPRETILHARILKNGTVTQVKLEKGSGDETFDRSAIRAVQKASPFPPLPSWYDEPYLDVGIRFHDGVARKRDQ